MKQLFLITVALAAMTSSACAEADTVVAWGPPSNNVQMSILVKAESLTFNRNDINDFQGLVERLRLHPDRLSAYLWDRFSATEQFALYEFGAPKANAAHESSVIVGAINRICKGESIYDARRFDGIMLGEARGLLVPKPDGTNLARLNHLLFEDAFPLELARPLNTNGVPVGNERPLMLTIILRSLSTNKTLKWAMSPYLERDSLISISLKTPSGKMTTVEPRRDAWSSAWIYSLEPKGALHFAFDLGELYKFEATGLYQITAKLGIATPGEVPPWFFVVSNPLDIRVESSSTVNDDAD